MTDTPTPNMQEAFDQAWEGRTLTREQKTIVGLFDRLKNAPLQVFDNQPLNNVPTEQGVYVICGSRGKILYVGRTRSRRFGLKDRLTDHRRNYKHKPGCKYRYLVVKDKRRGALLEALATGSLCPSKFDGSDKEKIPPASP
jgi:hypothetical protein